MKSRIKKPENFRRRFSLSQQDMARYLGVSQSLITQCEAGKRSLPQEAFDKMLALEMDLEKNKGNKKTGSSVKQLQKTTREQENKMAGKMMERSETTRYRTKMLEQKLEELSKKQQDQLAWLNLIDQRLAVLPENKSTKGERLWFENQQMDAAKRLLRMNKQMVKLGYDIEVMRAVAEVGERYFGRVKNKVIS